MLSAIPKVKRNVALPFFDKFSDVGVYLLASEWILNSFGLLDKTHSDVDDY